MSDRVYFTCTALPVNKKGIITPDSDGYYEVVIGALDAYSSAGDFYLRRGSEKLFQESSTFQRKIREGVLFGENGHPEPLPGQKFDSYAARVAVVLEKNTSHHFKKIWLDYNRQFDANGQPIILIVALVKPAGEKGYVVDDSLKNPNINTCFSIRSFTEDQDVMGVRHRVLTDIVTFDHVNESGMTVARKYSSAALESLVDIPFSREQVLHQTNPGVLGYATEASNDFYTQIARRKGWVGGGNMPMVIGWK